MSQTLAIPTMFPEPPSASLAERHGGLMVSVAFHIMLLVLLHQHLVPEPPAPPPPTTVHLAIAPPPMPPTPSPAPPLTEEVARTSPLGEAEDHIARDDSTIEEIAQRRPEPGEGDAEPTSPPAGRVQPDFAEDPDRQESPLISEATRSLMREQMEIASRQIEHQIVDRERIRGRLFAEQERMPTRNADYISQGAEEGRTREIDFSDVPLAVARQVLERYGATLERRVVSPDEITSEGPVPLNAARIGDQVLTAQRRGVAGEALLIHYGPELSARLIDLEVTEIAHRGLRLSRIAITRTVFAVRRVATGWDLCVRDIDYVEVEI